MTDALREAVARALHAHEWEDQPAHEPFHIAKDYWLGFADAALQAITDSGYAIVPVEPTEEMKLAGEGEGPIGCEVVGLEDAAMIYRAMIAKAGE